ncbi:UNVERIFIED_CONTAM: hypothetical protein FKN15_076442 [Acipenser sinensis]
MSGTPSTAYRETASRPSENPAAAKRPAEDSKYECVMRNQGNLKVILNSKLWAQMNVFKPARKKLCFTATDLENQVVRVFLIQACAKETGRLYLAIHHRLVALRSCCGEQETEENLIGLETEPQASALHCDSEDDER